MTRPFVNDDEPLSATSTSLLQRVKADDQHAWNRLVELYSPLIFHWCLQSRFQAADAADIGQDVFQAVARGIRTFHRDREGDTFRGWLRTITRNKIRDHARAKKNEPRSLGGSDAYQQILQIPIEQHAKEGSIEDRILYDKAIALLRSEFSDQHWNVFNLTVIEGRPPIDIAEDTGMSANNVRLIKSRILRRLREEFNNLIEIDRI